MALQNLKGIGLSMYTYANENADDFPPRLTMLLESGGLIDPETFWNPGDSDPRPLVIDNDLADQQNSTQISYTYFGGSGNLPAEAVVLQDNSLAHNAGQGLLVLTADARAEFFEKSTQTHPMIEAARANLVQIGQALHAYAGDNGGQFPAKLSLLYPAYISDAAVFWNPGDPNPAPATITNDLPNQANSAQISFHYRGAGYNTTSPPQLVLVSDNSLANTFGSGIIVLTADNQADFYVPETAPCNPVEPCTQFAASKLHRLGFALQLYAAEH
jgi:hypothetical protein